MLEHEVMNDPMICISQKKPEITSFRFLSRGFPSSVPSSSEISRESLACDTQATKHHCIRESPAGPNVCNFVYCEAERQSTFIKEQRQLHGGTCLVPFSPHNMLPDVPQLLNTYRFDEKVNCSMCYSPQNNICLAIGGHHCNIEMYFQT